MRDWMGSSARRWRSSSSFVKLAAVTVIMFPPSTSPDGSVCKPNDNAARGPAEPDSRPFDAPALASLDVRQSLTHHPVRARSPEPDRCAGPDMQPDRPLTRERRPGTCELS